MYSWYCKKARVPENESVFEAVLQIQIPAMTASWVRAAVMNTLCSKEIHVITLVLD